MRFYRSLILSLLALLVVLAPAQAGIKDLKGFDKKVYDGSLALYASSHLAGVRDRFICTVQVFKEVKGQGYLLLGAGHCTSANPELPPDLEYAVADDLGGSLTPVILLQSHFEAGDQVNSTDYAEYFMRTDKKYPVTQLGDESDARIGDETIDVHFSLELGKFASYGRVSSKTSKVGDMKGFFGDDQLTTHGASGSAVVDKHTKKIIGIVIAGVDGTTSASWVEPVSTIKKALLRATMPKSQVPYVPKTYPQYLVEPDNIPALPEGTTEQAPPVGCVFAKQAKIVNGVIVSEKLVVACQAEDGHWFNAVTGEPF